ncbi:hypothetical protein [Peribacillus frigoritolerans]|uniref:hypothetical protein n=1 Tax=Peribacillus frigoritolerans TaxID=450367 RepID=UPI0020795769|nr:hypothetical protein [Peribacillus frigoritolerans]USK77692.1 hypothetical protein LIT31_26415 [Peribacillus frigoritolerans]USK77770.1 hypothetical protein LIT31_25935 [Peribacillus frigoritolerans]USK77896.1 hypothetical protein LIT31_26795 [Peribacillus frigoritolerans]
MNKAVADYIEKRAYNMAIHCDLTHFDSTEGIFMYIVNNANDRMERALQDTLNYYIFSRSFEVEWKIEQKKLKGNGDVGK